MRRRIDGLEDRLGRHSVGAVVVVLPLLVAHDVALVVELVLGQRRQKKAHAVTLEPQAGLEKVGRQRLEIVRAIGVGGAVGGAARLLDVLEVHLVGHVRRALEHHVLEQVREAGLARHLVARADVIPDVDGDDGHGVIFLHQDGQAVVELELGERQQRGQKRQREHGGTSRCHDKICNRCPNARSSRRTKPAASGPRRRRARSSATSTATSSGRSAPSAPSPSPPTTTSSAARSRRRRASASSRSPTSSSSGPTGSRQDPHRAQLWPSCLNVPFTVADATEYTEAGYYGKDVEVMVGRAAVSSRPLDRGRRSAASSSSTRSTRSPAAAQGARTGAGARDIGGEGVQQALLKLLEGREIFVPLNVTQHWNKHDFVQVDTQDILFIAAGTFTRSARCTATPSKPIGFGGERRGRGRSSKPRRRRRSCSTTACSPSSWGACRCACELDPLDRGRAVPGAERAARFARARVPGAPGRDERQARVRRRGAARIVRFARGAAHRRARPARRSWRRCATT